MLLHLANRTTGLCLAEVTTLGITGTTDALGGVGMQLAGAGVTALKITGATDTVASVSLALASTDSATTNSFGYDLDAVASTDGVTNSCNSDAEPRKS